MQQKKVVLIIMDGWGIGQVKAADAIQAANTPFVSSLYASYPNTTLTTCGEAVGLPEGQMGNSEVGHLNLGAGRVVYQELQRINVAIREGELAQNSVLLRSIQHAKELGKPLHLLNQRHSIMATALWCRRQRISDTWQSLFKRAQSLVTFLRHRRANLPTSGTAD